MAESGYISYPCLEGTLVGSGPGQGLLSQPHQRIYPFHLGARVRATSTGTAVSVNGKGQLAVSDYVMACREVDYGGSPLYVPDTGRVALVTAVDGSDDAITISPALELEEGEWLFNLGQDSADTPLLAPEYDGSRVKPLDDPTTGTDAELDYVLTGQGGWFRCWLPDGTVVVDLLVASTSGVPRYLWPCRRVGAEILP